MSSDLLRVSLRCFAPELSREPFGTPGNSPELPSLRNHHGVDSKYLVGVILILFSTHVIVLVAQLNHGYV